MKLNRLSNFAIATAIALAGLGLVSLDADAKAKGNGGGNGGGYLAGECEISNVLAGSVSASTCSNFTGNDSQVGFVDALNNGTVASLAGYSSLSPDFATEVSALDGTWSLFGKSDENGDKVDNIGEELSSGDWSFSESLTNPFVVVLKASDYYAAYLFQDFDEAIDKGEFNVEGITSHSTKDKHAALSHMSVYSFVPRIQEPEPVDIPEPTAVASLLAVAGVASYSRQRSLKAKSGSAA